MCLNILMKAPYFKVVLDDHLWKVYRVLITKIIDSLLNFASIISFVRLYFLTANFLTLTYIDMKWKEKDLTICSFRFSFLNVQCFIFVLDRGSGVILQITFKSNSRVITTMNFNCAITKRLFNWSTLTKFGVGSVSDFGQKLEGVLVDFQTLCQIFHIQKL